MPKVNTITVGKSGYATGVKRTDEEWDTLFADTILPALRDDDATMTELRAQYGRSEEIRKACRRAGFRSIAEAKRTDEGTLTAIKVKGVQAKVVARRCNEAREGGDSWNTLKLRTGLAVDELKALLTKHGYETVTTGRVVTSTRGKARLAKAQAEAQAAAAKAKARKPRARKAKVAA